MFETLPVPIENGFGVDNHQSRLPILPHFPQTDPKQTIHGSDLGTANRSLENCHLLPERKIFQSDLFRTSEDHEGHAKKTENCIEHEFKSVAALLLKNKRVISHMRFWRWTGPGNPPEISNSPRTPYLNLKEMFAGTAASAGVTRLLTINHSSP